MLLESKCSMQSSQDHPESESPGAFEENNDDMEFGGQLADNDEMAPAECQIVIKKKAMTRSMFTIDEEDAEDGTVLSSSAGYADNELEGLDSEALQAKSGQGLARYSGAEHSGLGQSQYFENNALIELGSSLCSFRSNNNLQEKPNDGSALKTFSHADGDSPHQDQWEDSDDGLRKSNLLSE